ncbi:MAG TPA: alpha-E domain-containing protein [Streptosporangiaceae bacterium]|nr:alpha-E domain-containing protein [Streptosporangiaceae bacterium]
MSGGSTSHNGLLSRIAETLFWTGRYIERADDTARMVDVYVHRMLEEPRADEDDGCRALLAVLGIKPAQASRLDIGLALEQLAYDVRSPSAIAGAVLAARTGARSVREVISSEMWECLNVTGLRLAAQHVAAERLGPAIYLRFIRERAALFFGLADSTMSHDDAWRFLVLGRSLERVDMTARLLLARMPATPYELGWPMLLRACGAYESFIRTRSWIGESRHVAEFLILDRLFPRSVLHALATAEECLAALDPGPVRAGMGDLARRPIGRMRTRLEYADPQLVPGQLADLLGAIQQTCLEASEAITERYFTCGQPVAWEQEGRRWAGG